MSTYANLPAQPTTKNAALASLTAANLKLQSTIANASGTIQTSTYVYVGANADDKTIVTVRREKVSSGIRNSVRLLTEVTRTNPISDEDELFEYEAVLAWNHPGDNFETTADQAVMLEVLVSLVFTSYDGSTGVPAATALGSMNYGITQLW